MDESYPVPERVPNKGSQNGAVYLGPYRSAGSLDTCIEALGRIFPLRRCDVEDGTCFYGQMGRCAPCSGMSEEEYRTEVIGGLVALLRGEGGEEHLEALVRERNRLADGLEFEAAARLRDLISGIERIRLMRALVSAEGVRAVIALSTEPGMIEVFAFSEGRFVAHRGFEPSDSTGLSLFARAILAGYNDVPSYGEGTDEARIVASYLRRRQVDIEAVHLQSAVDLVEAAKKMAEGAAKDVDVEKSYKP